MFIIPLPGETLPPSKETLRPRRCDRVAH